MTKSRSGAAQAKNPAATRLGTERGATPTVPLAVVKAGTGKGTVTSSPAGISCGASCSWNYTSGTVVRLSAAPAAGSIFTGWSGGGCSGTGSCTVTMTVRTKVTATFKRCSSGTCP